MIRALAVVALVGCGSPQAPSPKPAPPVDPDVAACDRLCAKEKACGANTKDCGRACAADRARMKSGFVTRYVRCYLAVLEKQCSTFDDAMRDKTNQECFDATIAEYKRDDENQRAMAEPVCNRLDRCLALGKEPVAACVEATLHPHESEVQLGQRVVDAFRRERVVEFRACVDESPCPKPGEHDDAAHACYAKTIEGAS